MKSEPSIFHLPVIMESSEKIHDEGMSESIQNSFLGEDVIHLFELNDRCLFQNLQGKETARGSMGHKPEDLSIQYNDELCGLQIHELSGRSNKSSGNSTKLLSNKGLDKEPVLQEIPQNCFLTKVWTRSR